SSGSGPWACRRSRGERGDGPRRGRRGRRRREHRERRGPRAVSGEAPKEPPGHGLLEGKVAVVTAAAGTGIGGATARRLLAEGATVVISDAHERRLSETAAELAQLAPEPPLAIPCDVTVEDQVQALFRGAAERHGRIDVVVNNAGLGGTAELVE